MKRILKLSAILCGMVLLAAACNKSETVVITDNTQAELQQLVNTNLAAYKLLYPNFPGGIAMKVISKQGAWFASSGMGDINSGIHFRAASNTKTLTSTAILLLYQQGKLDINKKITDTIPGTQMPYLPASAEYDIPFKSSITILDLLRHRAGVFDVTNNNIPDTVSAAVTYKGKNYLDWVKASDPEHTFTFDELSNVNAICHLYFFPPETSYHYSNSGYSLLGKIIERVSGKTYQQFLTEDVMSPMGMLSSSMPALGTDLSLPAPFPTGYTITADTVLNSTLSNMSPNVAEGNLISTPDDLSLFLSKLLSGKGVLTTHTVNTIMMNCLPYEGGTNANYGCGLTYTNNLGYGHSGAHEGYLSLMVGDPNSGLTIVIFTNTLNFTKGTTSVFDELYGLLENTCYGARYIMLKNK